MRDINNKMLNEMPQQCDHQRRISAAATKTITTKTTKHNNYLLAVDCRRSTIGWVFPNKLLP